MVLTIKISSKREKWYSVNKELKRVENKVSTKNPIRYKRNR